MPVFEADQGDIVYVPKMRFHLASFAGTGPSCRLAMNGYTDLSHSYEPTHDRSFNAMPPGRRERRSLFGSRRRGVIRLSGFIDSFPSHPLR